MKRIMKSTILSTYEVEAILEGRKTQFRIEGSYTKHHELYLKKLHNKSHMVADIEISEQDKFDGFLPLHTADVSKYEIGDVLYVKEAEGIFLEVTNVRVERLEDISEADAIAEGVRNFIDEDHVHQFYIYPIADNKIRTIAGLASLCDTYISKGIFNIQSPAIYSFQTLWESINGIDSWMPNPWVWVYDFKVIDKPI